MENTVVVGYGNPIRGDDGVAWHVVQQLQGSEGLRGRAAFRLVQQLSLELAEEIASYDRVIFVDAHTPDQRARVEIDEVTPGANASPLTHQFNPGALLHLARRLHGAKCRGVVVSVRGREFSIGEALSPEAQVNAKEAIAAIRRLLDD